MKTRVLFFCILSFLHVSYGDSRSSANYNILNDAVDDGGVTESSANYQDTGSAGLTGGTASSATGNVVLDSGYVAQLHFNSIALEVVSAVSRKVHGATGTFDITLPLTGLLGVESRASGAGASHKVVVTFAAPVSVGGASVMSGDGQAGAAVNVSGAIATIDLAKVANAQTLGITLSNTNDQNEAGDLFIPMGVLLGDSSGNGTVNSGDAIQVRSRSGQAISLTNFRSDLNADGSINSGDAIIVRSRSGTTLP